VIEQAGGRAYQEALARARQACAGHPPPLTPGLRITETDPELSVLYEDVQQSQLSWEYLLKDLPDDRLLWLAGHLHRPTDMTDDDRWQKLDQNAWRARAASAKREAAAENIANRRVQLVSAGTAFLAGILAAAIALAGVWLSRSDPPERLRVEIVNPSDVPGPAVTTTTPAPGPTTTR
jgi:hypothetical protein